MERAQHEIQEQLVRIQEESREQMAKITEMIMGLSKGKNATGTSNVGETVAPKENTTEERPYLSGYTPPFIPQATNPQSMPLEGVYTYTYAPPPLAQPSVPVPSAPVSGASPVDPMIVPDLDDPHEQEKLKSSGLVTAENTEAQQKYNLLEERMRAIEGVKILGAMEASELSLVPGGVVPPKFKVLDFDKYDVQAIDTSSFCPGVGCKPCRPNDRAGSR